GQRVVGDLVDLRGKVRGQRVARSVRGQALRERGRTGEGQQGRKTQQANGIRQQSHGRTSAGKKRRRKITPSPQSSGRASSYQKYTCSEDGFGLGGIAPRNAR